MSDRGNASVFTLEPLGETTLLLRFGDRIDIETNARVHAAAATLRSANLPGIVDIVAAYASLALIYVPALWIGETRLPWRRLTEAVRALLDTPPAFAEQVATTTEIPVCYGHAGGPDLEAVAHHCGLSIEAVITRHAGADYRVAMLGFAPGFAYLIGLDPMLQTPRRANPRQRVPRGSVAIGGLQTGVYADDLPGGWQVIGRTPLLLFNATRTPACLLAAGDHVRFRAIGVDEFAALERRIAP